MCAVIIFQIVMAEVILNNWAIFHLPLVAFSLTNVSFQCQREPVAIWKKYLKSQGVVRDFFRGKRGTLLRSKLICLIDANQNGERFYIIAEIPRMSGNNFVCSMVLHKVFCK